MNLWLYRPLVVITTSTHRQISDSNYGVLSPPTGTTAVLFNRKDYALIMLFLHLKLYLNINILTIIIGNNIW